MMLCNFVVYLLSIYTILGKLYTIQNVLYKSYLSFNCDVTDMMLDGSFRVISGDFYNASLLDHSSDLFQRKSHIYKLMASIFKPLFYSKLTF